MTRAIRHPVPEEVNAAQWLAGDPATSAWVEAHAGSGKTHVLTLRVLRLLLSGARPDEVLCLTYTKAAAAEMRQRISGWLGRWALLDADALAASLAEIAGRAPSASETRRARTLFAHALDTPGGLRIQTIHAFCEALLHRFPVEAGVPFDFAVLEDHQRAALIQRARETVLAGGLGGSAEASAVETLFGAMSDFSIGEAIDEALAQSRRLRRVLDDKIGARARLGVLADDPGRSAAEIRNAIETETLLAPNDCRELVRLLGGDARKGSGRFANALAGINLDSPACDDLLAAFMTDGGQGGPRKSLMAKNERLVHLELHARFEAEQNRIAGLADELRRAELIARSNALLDILDAILARYDADKRARSLLDFDDLVTHATALLANEGQGAWVRYKLDGRIAHILVDESQDTNPEQWRLVELLADEFFDGKGAVDRPRTIFAVGDGKQSIYSFQGADPTLFADCGSRFEVKAQGARQRFERVRLSTSFRTLPGVLRAVDMLFEDEDRSAAVLAKEVVVHATARKEGGGTVTLWPPLHVPGKGRSDGGGEPGDWPLEPGSDVTQDAPRQVATRIARQIRSWVEEGRPLGGRKRAVRFEDVLILVQTRNALFHELIRALHAEQVPTPGADRLFVTTHIAVRDLMALGDVLLNTSDDLQLAALLRSPLFEFSDDDLFAVAHGRKGALWRALGDSALPIARDAARRLDAWRSRLDIERPYEFFADILYAEGGLKRFHGRFGPEVDDLFSEFLDLALEHEHAANPSAQGFLAEMRAREVTITRELGTARNGVRVMTVHGAKGLESPIVIIADAAAKPQGRQLTKPVIIDDDRGVLIHASGRKTHVAGTLPLCEALEAKQQQEYWRKLYVAMTRAEDELYVTGALTPGTAFETQLKGTWYEAIDACLAPHGEMLTDAERPALVFPRASQAAAGPAAEAHADAATPVEALHLAPLAARRAVPFLSPSSAYAGEDEAEEVADDGHAVLDTAAEAAQRPALSRDPEHARLEGLALHALLQHLCRLPRDEWQTVADRALEVLLPDSAMPAAAARRAALAARAISILGAPGLAHIFGPDSRAEVPFLVKAHRDGKAVRLAGRIDRLVANDDGILVVDFKSDATPPRDAKGAPAAYVAQLGAYAFAASQLFPGIPVTAAILWTGLELLLELDREAMVAAVSRFTMR